MSEGTVASVLVSVPERRNRFVLYSLSRHTETAPVELEVLVRDVAAWEQNEAVESVSEETFETVLEDLTRTRLPILSSRGLADFDPLSGLVGRPSYSVLTATLIDWLARAELGVRF